MSVARLSRTRFRQHLRSANAAGTIMIEDLPGLPPIRS